MNTKNNMPEVGPVGRNLIANVERLRAERGLSLNRLSALLEKAGRPVPPLGLSRAIKAERRIDVDELVKMAEVFDVTPNALLAPPGDTTQDTLPEHDAAAAARKLTACIEDLLKAADDPVARAVASRGVSRGLLRIQVEIEELLEDYAKSLNGHQP